MQLREYLTVKGLTGLQFAKLHGIGYSNVYYWMRGRHKPNKFYIEMIRKATRNKVREEDWNNLKEGT